MRHDFNEEHDRSKRIQSSLTPRTGECPPLVPVVSGYVEMAPRADSLVIRQRQHDQDGIVLDLEQEQLTREMVEKRTKARIIVQGMAEGGVNSDLLPPMGYKRAMDYDSGLTRKSSEPNLNLPPLGEAPPTP